VHFREESPVIDPTSDLHCLILVSSLIDELSSLEDIFAGHTGVVVKLTQAAVTCPEKQSSVLQSLLRAFHTEHDPKHCAPLFLSLMTHEVVFEMKDETEVYKNYLFLLLYDQITSQLIACQ